MSTTISSTASAPTPASGGRFKAESPCENQRRAPYGKALPCRLRKAEPCDTAPGIVAIHQPWSPRSKIMVSSFGISFDCIGRQGFLE
ncbi:MAG: hypothetical protein AB1716_10615 [Planctomycetota bacterium]